MHNRLDIELTVAREKQQDLLRQVEQDQLVRLARAGRRTRVKAGSRARDRLDRWLYQLCLGGRTDRCPRVKDTGPYLLNALAWMMAKE